MPRRSHYLPSFCRIVSDIWYNSMAFNPLYMFLLPYRRRSKGAFRIATVVIPDRQEAQARTARISLDSNLLWLKIRTNEGQVRKAIRTKRARIPSRLLLPQFSTSFFYVSWNNNGSSASIRTLHRVAPRRDTRRVRNAIKKTKPEAWRVCRWHEEGTKTSWKKA